MATAALGTALVAGFMFQNITEGLRVIAPLVKVEPGLLTLAPLGLVGGAPAVVGAWVGGLVSSESLSVLFLAVGAGAVSQAAYEIGRERVWREAAGRERPLAVFGGMAAGMLALFVTGGVIE